MSLNRRTLVSSAVAGIAITGLPRLALAADTLKIGYVSPQTGPLAPFGEADKWVIDQMKAAFKGGIVVGGFLAGIGGSFLSLFYPGSWNEGLSSGQGITAVALVIFARWDPMLCLWASLAFGGAAALGPALQSVGVTSGYHLFNAAPYILTLAIMIITCSPKRTLTGAPAELSITR